LDWTAMCLEQWYSYPKKKKKKKFVL
jgi:hypothetical protein